MKKLDLFAPLLRGGRSAVVLLLLAVAVFAVQSVRADGPAQPKKRMSIALTGATLDDVLQHIKRETGYLLLYNSNSIKAVKGITLHRQNAPVEEILREAITGADVVHILVPFALGHAAAEMAVEMGIPVTASFHCQAENFTNHIFLMNGKKI